MSRHEAVAKGPDAPARDTLSRKMVTTWAQLTTIYAPAREMLRDLGISGIRFNMRAVRDQSTPGGAKGGVELGYTAPNAAAMAHFEGLTQEFRHHRGLAPQIRCADQVRPKAPGTPRTR
jgi:hypothetical protein